ncbi:ATP-binding protein, partial [bacterium]|nr:ATP-binding protein [bacterium]
MKIKSAKSFRYWYKTKVKEIERDDHTHNENFVGTYHKENGKKTIKGFFEMYHGDKPDIASYLPSILKIAEDGQAIYEFLQNAVDCGSTHFYIFYNEKYFLAINNGSPFDIEGLQSILNIAQTTKKDPDKIGRFGIGFKLAHRLVGKNEGTDELVRQYKGPILFSWAKLEDLESLMRNEQIEPLVPNKANYQEFINSPYLLKLLLTNFPSDPNETVKDISYKDKILFPQSELKELIDYLNENFEIHSDSLKKNVLKQGSLFFIKLGEEKKKLLDKDYSELVNGIQYSMNTLKNLQKVYINSDDIGKIPLQLEVGSIKKGSVDFEKISPEYKEFDIKFSIGFNTINFGNDKSYEKIKLLKEKPNFYKYFPMGDEINGFGFIIHCDSFSNEANRRKLHEDDINRNLFPVFVNHITQRLEDYKTRDRSKFLNLYASILLSDIPERQNNKWLRPIFYDALLKSLQNNVPTKNGFSDNSQNVKINKLKIPLNLSDFGLSQIEWFEWDNEADKLLIDEATKNEKLGIKSWDIADIVENANLEDINNWIASCDKKTYEGFLKELEERYLRKETKEKICKIKLFKFSDGEFYSFNEVIKRQIVQNRVTFNYGYSNVFLKSDKTAQIVNELEKLGIILSEVNVSEYPNIFSAIERMPDEKIMYLHISERCKTNTLKAIDKKKLFINFINEATKFDNVAEGTLKDLELFCDSTSTIKPLKELIGNIKTASWLTLYKIKQDEYFPELNSYLISDSESIFKDIYQSNQDEIIDKLTEAEEIISLIKLYQDNKKTFFKEFIIKKENNKFVIDAKTKETYQVQSADKAARMFIDENCADNLFVLPYEFVEKYKDEEGIIKADDLHSLILDFVDVDEHKEILVDIVKYKAKHKFLQDLSEFRFNSKTKYAKEDY